jgi:L-aspartate oxidase
MEMERTGDPCVHLDLTGRKPALLKERFPQIYETCLRFGFDLARDRIPVHPSAHYFMGGVRTDLSGRTTVPGLYAAGEVACTGVHGANRLASNSLLEGLVFGARSASAILQCPREGRAPSAAVPATLAPGPSTAENLARDIRDLMWGQVGIRREGDSLRAAVESLNRWKTTLGLFPLNRASLEARNLLILAGLVARAALEREESRGAHFRGDFPAKSEGWQRHLEYRAELPAADLPRQNGNGTGLL